MRPRWRVAAVVGALAVLAGAPADPFRINTSSTGAQLHWPAFPIPFILNQRGAPSVPSPREADTDPGVPGSLDAVRAAFQTWAQVSGARIRFTDQGLTNQTSTGNDRTNLVLWRTADLDPDKFQDSTLAVTVTFFQPSSGDIIDADIEFNGVRFAWGVNRESDRPDVQSVAVHEIGHFLGLGHVTDPTAIMFPSIRNGQIKRILSSDEVAAAQFLYPGTGPPLATSPLAASASASPTSGSAPLTVRFTASVSGGTAPYTFAWTFGDGQTSSLANPTHTYGSASVFNATLTVTDATGQTTAAGVSVAVTAPTVVLTPTPTPPPGFGTEGLTISPTTASPGDPLTLTVVGRPGQVAIIAFSTQNSGARVGSLGLALGPDFGAVGAGPINALGVFLVTRAVPAGLPPGSYFFQAALTTDANTLRDLTLTNGVSLVVGARGSFSASVAGQPTAGAAPLTVAFTSTLTGGVAPYLYAWTFGDGTTSTVANPRKTYSAPGVYLVTLTVTDAEARTVVSNPVTIIVLRDSPS